METDQEEDWEGKHIVLGCLRFAHKLCKSVKVPGFVPNCESSKEKALYNPMKVSARIR